VYKKINNHSFSVVLPITGGNHRQKTQFNDVYNYYVPTIIKKGCQLKNRHPAPSGLVAA